MQVLVPGHIDMTLCHCAKARKPLLAKEIGDMMTTYGWKWLKGSDKLGEKQQMQINWGDVRNIHSIV